LIANHLIMLELLKERIGQGGKCQNMLRKQGPSPRGVVDSWWRNSPHWVRL